MNLMVIFLKISHSIVKGVISLYPSLANSPVVLEVNQFISELLSEASTFVPSTVPQSIPSPIKLIPLSSTGRGKIAWEIIQAVAIGYLGWQHLRPVIPVKPPTIDSKPLKTVPDGISVPVTVDRPTQPLDAFPDTPANPMLDALNSERKGLPKLTGIPELDARAKVLLSTGHLIYQPGLLIGSGSPQELVARWIGEPKGRATIEGEFSLVGISQDGETWCVLFGK